ncbi:hypothetical protein K438DRAFT_2135400 [Mycena galopus ATCC 62051]|nr:hypothetical protein K438DRAFT_2135400 [Mycena galopus ATCC 62051]
MWHAKGKSAGTTTAGRRWPREESYLRERIQPPRLWKKESRAAAGGSRGPCPGPGQPKTKDGKVITRGKGQQEEQKLRGAHKKNRRGHRGKISLNKNGNSREPPWRKNRKPKIEIKGRTQGQKIQGYKPNKNHDANPMAYQTHTRRCIASGRCELQKILWHVRGTRFPSSAHHRAPPKHKTTRKTNAKMDQSKSRTPNSEQKSKRSRKRESEERRRRASKTAPVELVNAEFQLQRQRPAHGVSDPRPKLYAAQQRWLRATLKHTRTMTWTSSPPTQRPPQSSPPQHFPLRPFAFHVFALGGEFGGEILGAVVVGFGFRGSRASVRANSGSKDKSSREIVATKGGQIDPGSERGGAGRCRLANR